MGQLDSPCIKGCTFVRRRLHPDALHLWLRTTCLVHLFIQASGLCENEVEIVARVSGISAPRNFKHLRMKEN